MGYVGVGHLSDLQMRHPDTSPPKSPALSHMHRYHYTYAYPAARFGSRGSPVRIRPPRLTQHTARQLVTVDPPAARFPAVYVSGVRYVPRICTETPPANLSHPSAHLGSAPRPPRAWLSIRGADAAGFEGLGPGRANRPKDAPNIHRPRTPLIVKRRPHNCLPGLHACYPSRRASFQRDRAALCQAL